MYEVNIQKTRKNQYKYITNHTNHTHIYVQIDAEKISNLIDKTVIVIFPAGKWDP